MLPQSIIAIAVVAAFVSQVVSGQNCSISPNSSSSFNSWSSFNSSISPCSVSPTAITTTGGIKKTTEKPPSTTTVTSPKKKTCGSVTLLWKKTWNDSYKDDRQFAKNTIENLQKLLEDGFDSTTYQDVNVSDLTVTEGKGGTSLKFKLCLVVIKNNADGYIEDKLKKVQKFDNHSVTEHKFEISGVTFSDWKAEEGECKVCSGGGGGPFTIKRKCTENDGYSCRGAKTTKQSKECVTYCSPAAAKRISSFILVLSIILSFSFDF